MKGQPYFALRQLVTREMKRKYSRSRLGILWSVLSPLLSMAVLSLVFSTMFRKSIENYPVYYLTGFVIWSFFTAAPGGQPGPDPPGPAAQVCLPPLQGGDSLCEFSLLPGSLWRHAPFVPHSGEGERACLSGAGLFSLPFLPGHGVYPVRPVLPSGASAWDYAGGDLAEPGVQLHRRGQGLHPLRQDPPGWRPPSDGSVGSRHVRDREACVPQESEQGDTETVRQVRGHGEENRGKADHLGAACEHAF